MADQIRHRSVTVPARTLQANPAVTSLSFPPAEVQRIEVRVPPGHAGQTGFQLMQANQPVIPFDTGEFIVTDDEVLRMDIENFLDSGSWQLRAYNTDVFAHTFYIRFYLLVAVARIQVVGGPQPFTAPADVPGFELPPQVVPPFEPGTTPEPPPDAGPGPEPPPSHGGTRPPGLPDPHEDPPRDIPTPADLPGVGHPTPPIKVDRP